MDFNEICAMQGDAFVEFATEEELKQFLTKEGVKYKENDLQLRKAYFFKNLHQK